MHRILYIVATLTRGGTTTQLSHLAAGLPRDEFEVHVVALNAGGPAAADLQPGGIEPVIIGRRWTFDPATMWRLRQHIQRLQPHLVHTWSSFAANTYGRLAALWTGVPWLVATERRIGAWKSGWENCFDRWLARRTDRIVANSMAVRDFYVACGLPQHKFTVIPSGVPPATASSVSRGELLAELALPPEAKLIGYLGPLTKEKRLKELIWATDQLKAVGVPAHLLIVGEGPLRQPLERYRWLNQVEDRVHFLGLRHDVPRLLPHLDVLWQAEALEGQSNAILEAMAAGIPVVAADVPGNRELVVTGETGYLVPLAERAGFARWTLPLVEDADLARRLGAAGRQRVLEYHRVEDMLARHVALYRKLLT